MPDIPAEACIFCRPGDPTMNRVMVQTVGWYARYDNFPAAPGHVEIVPKRHVESYFDLTREEAGEAFVVLGLARKLVELEHSRPDGYTIGINEGRAAGRSIDHLHIHLIPRYVGDVPDPRGGIRRALPNGDPDAWTS